jgi:hypothetical protein
MWAENKTMKKSIIISIVLGLFVAINAFGATAANNTIVSKQPATISIASFVKPSDNKTAAWQEAVKANPEQKIEYRIDVENIAKEVQKNVYVQAIFGRNLTVGNDFKIDNKVVQYDAKKGLFLGDIAKGQTKVITFTAKIGKNENLSYGQNELVAVFVLDKSHVPVADAATVYVWRQGLAGTTTGPIQASSLNTGLNTNLGDFIILPFLLAIIATFIFRKQFAASFVNFQDSARDAEAYIAQKKLEKMIQDKK